MSGRVEEGMEVDGFVLGPRLHAGGMATIHAVRYAQGATDPGFPLVMKIPQMGLADGAENIVGFEVELHLLQNLEGRHVPRFVAAGDLDRLPYLVMEHVAGETLEAQCAAGVCTDPDRIAQIGAAVADALHSLHQQNACHLDLKPANIMLCPDGHVVLLDFGLSCHGHFPDLLAEETRKPMGSAAWIAPEQVVGVRGDPRSDVYALGVILYQLATGELPFGAPQAVAAWRHRLWMDPLPPRCRVPALPAWLQEIILRCLEPEAAQRYASAAHLAFDLRNPTQVRIGERGQRLQGTGFWTHFRRWLRAAGRHYLPSPLPTQQISEVPIVMVALPYRDVSDATLYALRQAVGRSLGLRPGARLACVTVIAPGLSSVSDERRSETSVHRQFLVQQQRWAQGLDLDGHQVSYHVLESNDPAEALLEYARNNHVSLIVLGAATHGKTLQRWVATIPIKVAMEAPCTVMLVKQELPFARLQG